MELSYFECLRRRELLIKHTRIEFDTMPFTFPEFDLIAHGFRYDWVLAPHFGVCILLQESDDLQLGVRARMECEFGAPAQK